MVHVPAKFRENTSMRFLVTVRKLNVTDRQTDGQTDRQKDGGALQYLPSRAFGAAGDNGQRDRQTDGGLCNISRPGHSAPREIIKGPWASIGPLSFCFIEVMHNEF